MEVPFGKIGPGQSGRFAYQVMGNNGPITNPNMIRFMPVDSSEIPASEMLSGPFALQAGLSGASLVASVMNLAVSSYIAIGVADLRKRLGRVEAKIDYIMERVERIDTQVAENNLRHAITHTLRRAVMEDRIDLRCVAEVSGDLDRFTESLPGPLFLNFSLRVSSDVRETVRQMCDLLYGIRAVVVQSYNITIKGDPENVVSVSPERDYFHHSLGADLESLVVATTVLGESVDVTEEVTPVLNPTKVFSRLLGRRIDQFEKMRLQNIDKYLPEPHRRMFSDVEEGDYGEKQKRLRDLVNSWLYRSDAGLFYRASQEMHGLNDGYEEIFWPQKKRSETCDLPPIDVICELPEQWRPRQEVEEPV